METAKATTDEIACTLTESEKRARQEELRAGVLGLITAVCETDDGFAFAFAPGSVDTVREFVSFESCCCGFMTYTIDVGDGGPIWLHLRGPAGAKTFIRSWLPERILEIIE